MLTLVKMAMYLRAIVDKVEESDGEFHFSDVEVEMSTEKSAGLALGGLLADHLECFQRLPDEGTTSGSSEGLRRLEITEMEKGTRLIKCRCLESGNLIFTLGYWALISHIFLWSIKIGESKKYPILSMYFFLAF